MTTIAKIDTGRYAAISSVIISPWVIITDERVEHIRQRHPGDWERYGRFIADTLLDPDFILRDEHPDTAVCVRRIEADGETRHLRTTLRLQIQGTSSDKVNSVLTFQKINQKEYGRLSRNKKVVYRRQL